MQFDVATLLVQWAAGGLLFCWVTTRRREVGIGYGWLLRISFGSIAILGVAAGWSDGGTAATVRNLAGAAMVLGAALALWSSVVRRSAGVSGHRAARAARVERVAAMTGRDAAPDETPSGVSDAAFSGSRYAGTRNVKEFDPRLDLIAPVFGLIAVVAAADAVGGALPLSLARLLSGALFLGVVSDAMLLGHWYLVQPGLGRDPIRELVKWTAGLWPVELIVWLIPTGMISVIDGSIDDGYGGLIGWMWIVSALTTIGLVIATWFALKEKAYSAVMAATGLLYLAILTGFGMDLLPRAVLG